MPNRRHRPVSGLASLAAFAFPYLGYSGLLNAALAYRCGGSTGLARKGAHRFPVSPPARRQEAPETGRHMNIRPGVRQRCACRQVLPDSSP
ncbi:hypothetical protein PFLCHA0_c23020 [Pseudomonas protegens CHA0]|uniref:Uncharacterized protein n=1 Tax=Pseudomonas protegens (strain DSM 19095 / LMG 27888 / CFBP 6595 / CHA0) TaxID=1124983 RepID=A0A2C9EK77_PSEPH|nr:hypothetical protein PFLCHA0_c23020 [Pseudomonas protegens CHA0]